MHDTLRMNVLGFLMNLTPGEYVDDILLQKPDGYDAEEFAYLFKHLKSGDIFLDVGAYIGLYSLVASKAVGEQRGSLFYMFISLSMPIYLSKYPAISVSPVIRLSIAWPRSKATLPRCTAM